MKGGPVRAAQVRIAELEAELAQYRANFNAFRILLHSAKFTGTGEDGSRKDWIATADVLCWLSDTQRDALQAAAEVAPCPHCGAVLPVPNPDPLPCAHCHKRPSEVRLP